MQSMTASTTVSFPVPEPPVVPFLMQKTGLTIRDNPDFEVWYKYGYTLADIRTSLQWSIGDWLIYGEAHFEERYAQGMDLFELEYGTLRNYVWVATQIPVSFRNDKLSWSHHNAVARESIPLAAKVELLRLAAESNPRWSSDELRDYANKRFPPEGKGGKWEVTEALSFEGLVSEARRFLLDALAGLPDDEQVRFKGSRQLSSVNHSV